MDKQPDIIISTADLAELEYQLEHTKLPPEFTEAIENELARAKVVKSSEMPSNVVGLGSQVTFKILETQEEFTKTLCLSNDSVKYQDSISVFAPIGSALLGLSVGQHIKWQTQRGEQSVEIIQVSRI